MKREVRITVAGQTLTISTDETERYVKQLAEFVSEHMRELGRGQKGSTTLTVAILAALNIADEYHKLREAQDKMSESIDALAGQLEASMGKEAVG